MPIAVLAVAVTIAASVFLSSDSSAAAPVQRVRVVNEFPHDPSSFCQGLVVHKGNLIEGTGHYNQSRLMQVDLETGKPSVNVPLPGEIFGEGVTVWKDTIIQLTWRNGYLITYNADTFERTGTVRLRSIDSSLREGWGITHDGTHLIISDGSPILRFVNPETFQAVRRLRVTDGRRAVSKLNELEFVNGEIFANVWYSDRIARIDPETGRVIGWLELKPLRPRGLSREAALNGIAWDAASKRLFVTGKNWPTLYEIEF
ncbi:Glutamine cyclotransferase [Fuerstiella marisgermanici]|uniref:Glutamine cyclotransferase n=2 Tax=Fuerstiella marisgermanici TaxID=1891926 RepID=A0A1P8WRL4_9PLAN|nr:Glutamine cyclotransferase [Fuerstiella marisgermanici]